MERIWLFTAALAVFAIRDGLTVTLTARAVAYLVVSNVALAALAGHLGGTLSITEIGEWLARPWVIAVGVAVHSVQGLCTLRRTTRTAGNGYVEITPTPLHFAALILLSRDCLENSNDWTGLWVGGSLAASYLSVVLAVSLISRRHDVTRHAATRRLSVAAHLSAILLVTPISFSGGSKAPVQSGAANLGIIAAVLLVPVFSFVWHRYRSRTATLSKSR